ncbi:Capsular synthesis regulator component B [Serratia marcescens]|uniref:helix-turn-helix transcriptional regulator n=1 Tax=Serratia marcescens TaxID=615 RepID=UPI00217BE55F|nr:LuxR C-terminal-related transcriptional regulator [Serratia marcescens]CAI0769370.1 Capsular synthesis regulator component B [Serratia marcescens]
METTITLAFIDNDRFFIEGLQQLLLPYFARRGMRVQVFDAAQAHRADMVFQSVERDWQARFCLRSANGGQPINFALREPGDTRWRDNPRCISEAGVIFRNDSPGSVLSQLERVLAARTHGDAAHRCYWCERQRITRREQDVMRYLACELPQTAIARNLHLSVKTVSNHKQAAMRKLGFKRNADLYHWLRLGGLKTVERARG